MEEPETSMFGLIVPVRVRHVYAADRFSLQLLNSYGHEMPKDDLTLQLSARAQMRMRPGDPPIHALKLFDRDAKDGKTSDAPGPCPSARTFAAKLIARSQRTVVHIPLPSRRGWLDSLCGGTIEIGELYLDMPREAEQPVQWDLRQWLCLSTRLVEAGMAEHREPDDTVA